MKTILASPKTTAKIDEIITVDDEFADQLIESNSAELIEHIVESEEVSEKEEVQEEEKVPELVEDDEVEEEKKDTKKSSKKPSKRR